MKKTYKIIVVCLIMLICGLLVFGLLNKGSGNEADNSSNTAEETAENDSSSENKENQEVSEATIQEDQGDIIITIPDDQESAGE